MNSIKMFLASVALLAGAAFGDTVHDETDYLLDRAAEDFSQMAEVQLQDFRTVYAGKVGEQVNQRSVLCGEFYASIAGGKLMWHPFATLKTSKYEQWIGESAVQFCDTSASVLDHSKDFSAELKQRYQQIHSHKINAN